MDVEPAMDFLALANCPSTTASRIPLASAIPREVDPLDTINRLDSAVKTSLDDSKLKRTETIPLKRNEPEDNEIDIVLIPLLHFYDPPRAEERIGSLCHGCSSGAA
jgi:hypothetical protein